MNTEEKGPVIFMYVQHNSVFMDGSIYVMQPTLSDFASVKAPVFCFNSEDKLPMGSACINLGPKIYFLGGFNSRNVLDVRVFDTDHPNLGIKFVAPMHTPKESPLVFAADGMLYAIGCVGKRIKTFPLSCGGFATGYFERYHPGSDLWQVLPDPPLFHSYLMTTQCAPTVVGRRVFVGPYSLVFNLDSLQWDDPPLPGNMAPRFPCGSLYAQPSLHSLYYLDDQSTRCDDDFLGFDFYNMDLSQIEIPNVLKIGPLPLPLLDDDTDTLSLLNSPCFDPGKEQYVAKTSDLAPPPNIFYTGDAYEPWRQLFHLGGRFFCYIFTHHLLDPSFPDRVFSLTNSRGVWIKFFEEEEAEAEAGVNVSSFRTLASFFYVIETDFPNNAYHIGFSVIGSVPQSWIKASPVNKLQESMHLLRHKGSKVPQMDSNVLDHSSEVEVVRKDDVNRETDVMKLLAEREEEIRILAAELLRKENQLKSLQASMHKTDVVGPSVTV